MKITLNHFPFTVVALLVGFAGVYRSVGMAATAVALLGIIAARDSFHELKVAAAQPKAELPEETKRLMHDIQARITTIEYGIKARGF